MRGHLIRAAIALALVMLAGLAALAATGFLVAALYLALASVMPAGWAALLAGLLALIVAAGLLLGARLAVRRPRRTPPADEAEIGEIGARLAADLAPLARRHFPLIAGVSFAAGVALGMSARLRGGLWRAMMRHL